MIDNIGLPGIRREVFVKGDIFLNQKRVHINTSLIEAVKYINKKTLATDVTASIGKSLNGSGKLLLSCSRDSLTINDPSRILHYYYDNNMLGIGSNKFIEITGNDATNKIVTIEYINQSLDYPPSKVF